MLSAVILGITPLFFFPLTSDYYDFNKWTLLALAGVATLFLSGVRLALTEKLEFHWSPVALGLLALAVSSLTSTLIISSNKAEAATQPLGVITYLSLFLLTVSLSVTEKKQKQLLLWFLSAGAGVAGLVAIYGALGLGKALGGLPFLANPLWTPLGASIPLLVYLVITLPLTIGHALRSFKEKEEVEATIASGISIITIFGITVTIWQLVKSPIQLLPLTANWSILLETIKQPLHAFFGVGPENFLAAFTAGRPLALNAGTLWDTRFLAGSSFLFHSATTLGLSGVVAILFFLRRHMSVLYVLAFLTLLLLPPSLPILIVTVSLLLLTTQTSKKISILHSSFYVLPSPFSIAAGSLFILASIVGIYFLGRVYLADVAFGNALAALDKKDGTGTYQELLTAVARNPSPPRYHANLSQISLSLATAILNRASDTKTALSDKDKQLVTDFYQQAIREAKAAINKAPTSVIMWENLANIYRGFLGIATNADSWTIAALSQAIQLDPTNPLLRIQTGNVYLRTNRIDEAINMFQSAVSLKDDLANAHYNLAFAYRAKKQYLQAAIEFRRTGQLVRPGSTDADRINADIAETMSSLSSQDITTLSQTPTQPQTATTEEILSPVVEFSPIPTPKISFPTD